MRIYLNGLCAAGVKRFNDTFMHVNGTTSQMTVEDRLLIKALHMEKGWRCGLNDCRISCQTVETMHIYMHKRTYEQQFFGNHVNTNK